MSDTKGSFTNKVALVTAGGAGIGAATATAFAHHGAAVIVSDIDRDKGEAVAQRLRDSGAQAQFVYADAMREEDVQQLVATTVETFGGLDIAANIVGFAHRESLGPDFHLQTMRGWNGTMDACLSSVFLSMKHEIAYMVEHGGGAICNVTSLAALVQESQSGAAYGVAKAAVIRLSKFAAVNYADRKIRVNCIAPGTTPTEAFQKLGPEAAEQLIKKLIAEQPIQRAIDPSEQAEAIRWLCSDSAAMVTGHVLPVDGGWSAC